MKFIRILKNEVGASILMVLILTTTAVGGVSYAIMELLPRLNKSTNKSRTILNYKIFLSSLNDYVLYAVREKWCVQNLGEVNITNNSTTETGYSTNLLLSNDCGPSKSMEETVTYPTNLERILWDDTIIGPKYTDANPPTATQANTIMGLNYFNTKATPAGTEIQVDDIKLPGNKLILQLTSQTILDINDQHPLYAILNPVKQCIEYANITLQKETAGNNMPTGEEQKFSISIAVKIKSDITGKCQDVKVVRSQAFYTFYPRRNHTFALIKYGDLDTSIYADYFGPVYVAGDLVLASTKPKDQTSLFLNSVTLGIYDDGNGIRKSGKIVFSDGSPYTFSDRGDPFKSKQDNYDEIRGLLGGLTLDGAEDKGMVNLFDYTLSSNIDVATLEACVEEQSVITTPTENNNSLFVYKINSSSPSQIFNFDLAFTKRNRFKESIYAPVLGSGMNGINNSGDFELLDPVINEATFKASLSLKINTEKDFKTYESTTGRTTTNSLKLKLDKFGAEATRATDLISKLDLGTTGHDVTKNKWDQIFNSTDIFSALDEKTTYDTKVSAFMANCTAAKLAVCDNYGFNGTDCSSSCPTYDDTELVSAVNALKNKITAIKTILDDTNEPQINFKFDKVNTGDGKLILNKQKLTIDMSQKLKDILKYIDILKLEIDMTPSHNGSLPYNLRLRASQDTNKSLLKIEVGKYDEENSIWNYENLKTSDWIDSSTNTAISSNSDVVDVVELSCPEGVGIASWGLDMSASTNFAWNYANTPPGAALTTVDHEPLELIEFGMPITDSSAGFGSNINNSIVRNCIIKKDREIIYGFYVCENLIFEAGRTKPTFLIGTFVVKNIELNGNTTKINWYSVWNEFSADMILNDLNGSNPDCLGINGKTWKDIVSDSEIEVKTILCSPQHMVEVGPNNYTWTTIDPDIGIAKDGDAMTSQKVKRIQNWIVREISRVDDIK